MLARSVSYLLRESVARFTIDYAQRDTLEPALGSLDAPDYISAGGCRRFYLDGVLPIAVPIYTPIR